MPRTRPAFLLLTLLTLALTPGVAAQPDPLVAQQHEQVEQARAIIEQWRASGDGDVAGQRPLVITLFTGSDTDPAPDYRERLTRTMTHIQAFYAREMDRHGFGPLTFPLDTNDDGLLNILVVRGDRPNAEYDGSHGREIRGLVNRALSDQGISGRERTVVIFCNLTVWDADQRTMRHHSPYYAYGSSREGTAWQLDSVILDAAELGNTDPDLVLRDGQYGRISLGRYQSIFVGGVCHELGHALGLPHNKERADEHQRWGTALMGSGNRTYGEELRDEGPGSFLTLAHAMKLAVHPSFTGSVREMNRRPRSRFATLDVEPIADGRGVRLIGQVESDVPVHAVLAYLDPEGRDDYDATTHVAVPDADGHFTLDCTAFAGREGQIRLVRVHANGAAAFSADMHLDYTRTRDGQLTVQQPERLGARPDADDTIPTVNATPSPPIAPSCPHCLPDAP